MKPKSHVQSGRLSKKTTKPESSMRPNTLLSRLLIVIACSSVAYLSGCAYGDLKPEAALLSPNALGARAALDGIPVAAANWPNVNWWQSFGDPQLDALVTESLANSPTLRVAEARVRQADSFRQIEEAALLPRVDASLSSTRQHYSANGTTPHPINGTWQTVNQGMLSVGYEIDFWGKNRAAVEAAVGRRNAAEVDHYAARLMLASAIVQAYITFKETIDQLELAQRQLDLDQKVLHLTRRRFAAELDSQIDIKQAQAAVPATQATIAALNEAVELSRNRLAALLGNGPDRGRQIEAPRMQMPPSVSIPTTVPAELLGRRPDVVAQRWRVEAASQDIKVAKAQFYPNVNLAAFAGLQSLGFDAFTLGTSRVLGIGPAINLPIFEGGRLRGNLAAKDAAYDIAVEAYNEALIDGLHDIGDQLSSLRWLSERMDRQSEAVQTADEAAHLAGRRYAVGVATYLQVLTTQNAALTQRRLLIQLQARGLSLQANLSRALGGGYEPDLQKTDTTN
jgi:NodT family efflux transporter outer membrane factor (OMF) lipoprotein